MEENLIYKCRIGSHAYGTNLPTSDEDFGGIFIQPLEYFFGLQSFDMLQEKAEQDKSYYSLRKYASLAVANNPNVLELLFTEAADQLMVKPEIESLLKNREKFLSQKCKYTFVGYAKAQLYRIERHSSWLAQEKRDLELLMPYVYSGLVNRGWVNWRFGSNMVERVLLELDNHNPYPGAVDSFNSEFHIPKPEERLIIEKFRGSNIVCPDIDDEKFYTQKEKSIAGTPQIVHTFQKHLYDEAKKKRDQYVTWMAERNPTRHETELKFGYDTKHAMHLVRLLRMGLEILRDGWLTVKRPDAQELLDIRKGEWQYSDLIEYAEHMIDTIDEEAMRSDLPETPDIKFIDKLVIEITKQKLIYPMACIPWPK